jgi:hypothetical protein
LLENQFQHLDVNHRDKVIQVEEIHRYKHDNLCNQLMVELENQEQEEVHHQTMKNIYIILFGIQILTHHCWIHIFFKISFT